MEVGSFDDPELPTARAGNDVGHFRPLISGVGENALDKREPAARFVQQGERAVAILDIGGQNAHAEQEAERVDEDMALRAPGLWCYEAGQAAFDDVLTWFVRTFPRSADIGASFAEYNREASALAPGQNRLVAIDWWNGNRVPYADKSLRGVPAGLDLSTNAVDIYRALMDSICFGARSIVDQFREASMPVDRIVLTSGLAKSNPFLLQIMSDVLAQTVHVPATDNPTRIGAAIHGAVAANVVANFREGGDRFGARSFDAFKPDPKRERAYSTVYQQYRNLSACAEVRNSVSARS